jgi:hypothetical protein
MIQEHSREPLLPTLETICLDLFKTKLPQHSTHSQDVENQEIVFMI